MVTKLTMPRLGLTMDTGVILRWLKQPGETVSKGEALLEVETDKSIVEVEAPVSGFLRQIIVPEGQEVAVGTEIGIITDTADKPISELAAGEASEAGAPASTAPVGPQAPVASQAPGAAPSIAPQAPPAAKRVHVTPAARRRAQELGVDLSAVTGTGPGGRIQVADVERAAEAKSQVTVERETVAASPKPETAVGRLVPLSRMRQAIASQMTLSQQTVPQFSVGRHLDMLAVVDLHKALSGSLKQHPGVRLTITDLVIQAVARALRRHPYLNASYEEIDGKTYLHLKDDIHIGLAVALDDGLVVPVLRNADTLSLVEIARQRDQLVTRARNQHLSAEEISGATFTISNLGPMDVDFFTAIVNPPEAAILATGRIAPRVWIEDGQMMQRPMMTAVLSVDHRVADGAQAAAFMKDLAAELNSPEGWKLF